MLVPADVDFVAFFQSNCQFLSQNCRISRIALQGNATNKLSAITTTMEVREIQNNYSKGAAHFFAGFFAVIVLLMVSNLIDTPKQLWL